MTEPTTLEAVIEHIEATAEDSWCQDVVRTTGGQERNCFFGHLFNMGETEGDSNRIWDWFESRWATTYIVYPVNDGEHPDYRQATPKQRMLAFLRALESGDEDDTMTSMEKEAAFHEGKKQ